jgi:hypothetical protein
MDRVPMTADRVTSPRGGGGGSAIQPPVSQPPLVLPGNRERHCVPGTEEAHKSQDSGSRGVSVPLSRLGQASISQPIQKMLRLWGLR